MEVGRTRISDRRPVACLSVDILKDCPSDTHIAKVVGNGKSELGKMDGILTDPHVNTRFKIRVLIVMNVIVPKFECAGEVWQANAKFVKQLATVQMAPAKPKDARMLKYDEQ